MQPLERNEIPLLAGSIDKIENGFLHGWIIGSEDILPLILVDGVPAKIISTAISRPDVCASLGMAEPQNTGFAVRLPAAKPGAKIELLGITPGGAELIATDYLSHTVKSEALTEQVLMARPIAECANSVGIVTWDGTRNTVERAKTLYDIVSPHRPVVLICFLHKEYGGEIWPPLARTSTRIISIPWHLRHIGYKLLRAYSITFRTIWICGNNPASFELAKEISSDKSKFILDICEKDEDKANCGPDAPLNSPRLGLKRLLADQIGVRSVGGSYLQSQVGGEIIRHSRVFYPRHDVAEGDTFNIGCIGTVSSETNLLSFAKAVRLAQARTGIPFSLHVYGAIASDELRHKLENVGVHIYPDFVLDCIPDFVSQMHALAIPNPVNSLPEPIDLYEIETSIIDALSAGRPIIIPEHLVPPEMSGVRGVFPFNKSNFVDTLKLALTKDSGISIPPKFSRSEAYLTFMKLEASAKGAPFFQADRSHLPSKAERALVLIWKQHDAGIYGRRIDQIARSYKRQYPNRRVYVLEFKRDRVANGAMYKDISVDYGLTVPVAHEHIDSFYSDYLIIERYLELKKKGMWQNGVSYFCLCYESSSTLRDELYSFLIGHELFPHNTTFIVFPIINDLDEVADIIRPYARVVDIVDNELGWAKDNQTRCQDIYQYKEVISESLLSIFNSQNNMDWFIQHNLLGTTKGVLIPNWYTLPDDVEIKEKWFKDKYYHVLYSGNMNDRIDWDLLYQIALLKNVRLHLAGVADKVQNKLIKLLSAGAIYHGVLTERETLNLLNYMNGAIVAHKIDNISFYMDPMKWKMYQAYGSKLGYKYIRVYTRH